MVDIPLPLSTFPGIYPTEQGAGRLINCRAVPVGDNGPSSAVRHRVPGLASWGTSDRSTFRGGIVIASTLYVAFENAVLKFPSTGGAGTALTGMVGGTDRVFFAKNNRRPSPDAVMVCAAGVFGLVYGTDTIADLVDPDLPSPNSVCFLDGYFFFTLADGRCFSSGLNDTSINSNDFITTEAKADTLLRGIPWNGQLLLCGDKSIEVWADTANPTGFPFTRAAVIQRGIAGAGAIAGHQDGFGKALIFVGDDNNVHQLSGYTPTKISPPALDKLIEDVADKDTLEASVYISGGSPIWVLSCDAWTWEFEMNTQKWNERRSYLDRNWRGVMPINAFNKWLCGDTDTGNIFEISSATYTEAGNPLIAEVWSAPVQKFPNRIRCPRADFDFDVGVGLIGGLDPIETNPSVEISYSDDGGYSFSTPRSRKLGRQGKTLSRVTLFSNGQTGPQGRMWKVTMSDPRPFGLMAGDMSAQLKVG